MKIATIICTALMAFCLSACAQQTKQEKKQMKVLVAYFSASGVTKGAAEWQQWQVQTCMKSNLNSPTRMATSTGVTSRAAQPLR